MHPKHVHEVIVERFLYLQSLIHLPEIAALGEIGFDRTASPKYWYRQDETLRKVLALADSLKPISLADNVVRMPEKSTNPLGMLNWFNCGRRNLTRYILVTRQPFKTLIRISYKA